jgi:hypothetical protein
MNTIYEPYFYIIRHKPTGKLYAGSRTKNSKWGVANPRELLVDGGYMTSSKSVKCLIEEDNSSFEIDRIKVFKTGEEAYQYETRFLHKVDAEHNGSFLNLSNNNGIFSTLGKPMSPETKEKISKKANGRKVSEKTRRKLRSSCAGKKNGMYGKTHTPETKEKISKKASERQPDSQETRNKKAQFGKNNGMYGNGRLISGEKHYLYGKIFTEEEKEHAREKCKYNKKILIDGIVYRSIIEASRVLGISRYKIKRMGVVIDE